MQWCIDFILYYIILYYIILYYIILYYIILYYIILYYIILWSWQYNWFINPAQGNGTALVKQDSLQHLVYIQVLRSVRGAKTWNIHVLRNILLQNTLEWMQNIQKELNYGHHFVGRMRNYSIIFADIQFDTNNDKQILFCPTFVWNSMFHFCIRILWCT